MDALISIQNSTIGGEVVQTVNARDLHAILGNKDKFATWIKDRIEQFGFIENQDFVTYSGISEKGRPSQVPRDAWQQRYCGLDERQ
jgi:phage anti-repressor protein